MRFVHLGVGLIAAVFLVPLFREVWDMLLPTLTEGITNTHILAFYTIVPYALVAVIVIAAFLILRGRRHE